MGSKVVAVCPGCCNHAMMVIVFVVSVEYIFLYPRRRNAALLWRDSGGSLFIMLCSVMLPILSTVTPRLFARSLLRAMSTSEFKQAPHKYVPSTIAHYRVERISQTASVSRWMPDDVDPI